MEKNSIFIVFGFMVVMPIFPTEGHPIYDIEYLQFSDPWEIKKIFARKPLDEKFVEWVKSIGYKLTFSPNRGTDRAFTYFDARTISVGIDGPKRFIPATVMHELIHIAMPDERFYYPRYRKLWTPMEYWTAEKMIEDIAVETVKKNRALVKYAMKILRAN